MTNSESQQDEHARLAGEYEECRRKVASTEAELKRIGAAFVALGNKLQTDPASIPPERLTVEKDLAVLWLIDARAGEVDSELVTPLRGFSSLLHAQFVTSRVISGKGTEPGHDSESK